MQEKTQSPPKITPKTNQKHPPSVNQSPPHLPTLTPEQQQFLTVFLSNSNLKETQQTLQLTPKQITQLYQTPQIQTHIQHHHKNTLTQIYKTQILNLQQIQQLLSYQITHQKTPTNQPLTPTETLNALKLLIQIQTNNTLSTTNPNQTTNTTQLSYPLLNLNPQDLPTLSITELKQILSTQPAKSTTTPPSQSQTYPPHLSHLNPTNIIQNNQYIINAHNPQQQPPTTPDPTFQQIQKTRSLLKQLNQTPTNSKQTKPDQPKTNQTPNPKCED